MIERNQKEGKEKGNKHAQGHGGSGVGSSSLLENGGNNSGGEEDSDMDDDEEEEEEAAINWDRGEAERMYTETRGTLHDIYDQEQKSMMDQD